MDAAWKLIIDKTSNTQYHVICTNWYRISVMFLTYSAMRQFILKQTFLHGYLLAHCSHICKILMYILKFMAIIKFKNWLVCYLLK